jgi:hypothetical protein
MDSEHHARRHIVTHYPTGTVPEAVTVDSVSPRGVVHYAGSPATEAAAAQAALAAVDQLVEALRDEVGFERMDAILTAVNHLQMQVRSEAIARMVAAAGEMVDYTIAVFVPDAP